MIRVREEQTGQLDIGHLVINEVIKEALYETSATE